MTYYWSKQYFEGLKAIGEAYAIRRDYELFGEYCLQKEQGLKKLANQTSVKFVSKVEGMVPAKQLKIAIQLCQLNYDNPEVHSLINHSLAELIHAILKSASQETPDSIEVYRWYARYCFSENDEDKNKILEKALNIDPDDQLVLEQSVTKAFHYLAYMVHHLNENILIGNLDEAYSQLDVLKSQLPRVIDCEEKAKFQSRFKYYETLFRLWEKYTKGTKESLFIDWAYEQELFKW